MRYWLPLVRKRCSFEYSRLRAVRWAERLKPSSWKIGLRAVEKLASRTQ